VSLTRPGNSERSALDIVVACGEAATAAHPDLVGASTAQIAAALEGMAALLLERSEPVLAANAEDLAAAQGVLGAGLIDRLRLEWSRLERMSDQIRALAALPAVDPLVGSRVLSDGLVMRERRRPVGVVGANYEARPNVTIDVASQLVKSRNAGVLRTGAAALGSAAALHAQVIRPALTGAGIDGDAITLVDSPDREAARALVSLPDLIPLVILRGSGQTTRDLARRAAENGVRTLAHADGGGVLYVHAAADPRRVRALIARGLDRLGVCNRLNLLLIDQELWEPMAAELVAVLEGLGLHASLPPHSHPLGHEWALDDGNEATVTLAPVDGPREAALLANAETSGLAATVATEDADAAETFLAVYAGTGAFWNASTRLLDGFELLGAPETGINVDRVPGPRGPVTYRDLHLRQYVIGPGAR
jgi:glutamate-5-semialdehyde dehydrogenase